MLFRYDCHKTEIQNRFFFFPRPLREGGLVRCMRSKSPGTPATTATAVYFAAVCGREANRLSEFCTVGGTYQQRRHVASAWDKLIGSKEEITQCETSQPKERTK